MLLFEFNRESEGSGGGCSALVPRTGKPRKEIVLSFEEGHFYLSERMDRLNALIPDDFREQSRP